MSEQFANEAKIRLSEALAQWPAPVHLETMRRYVRSGLGGHRLEAVRMGSFYYTSRGAVQRFLSRVQQPVT